MLVAADEGMITVTADHVHLSEVLSTGGTLHARIPMRLLWRLLQQQLLPLQLRLLLVTVDNLY